MSAVDPGARDRALAAFSGLAIGDALGMPTESWPRAEILRRFGPLVADFAPGPSDQPVAAGLAAGSVTDDTEQSVLLAQLLIDGGGRIDPEAWALRLRAWDQELASRKLTSLLGPSTRRALDALEAGEDPATVGRLGTTNGAAMRITPVAIATPASDLEALVAAVVEASALTHNTGVALAAAAAVAAAISAGVDGAERADALACGIAAAARAAALGHYVAGADVAERCAWALRLAAETAPDALPHVLETLVGTSVAAQESVPAAFALVAALGATPWDAVRVAAAVGGDTDTIAAIVGAISGACAGMTAWPAGAVRRVVETNGLGLEPIVDALLALRARPPGAPAPAPAARPSRLVHAGSAIADLVLEVGSLPLRGGEITAAGAGLMAGGGVNVMVAAARQGARVAYAGAHGTGMFADLVRSALHGAGVELLAPRRSDGDTGVCVTLVERDGERSFVTRRGVEAAPGDLGSLAAHLRAGDALYLSGYTLIDDASAAGVRVLLRGLDDGVLVCLDPGPLLDRLDTQLLGGIFARADWLSANAAEAVALSGESDVRTAARVLAGRFCRRGVVVRTGSAGCLLAVRNEPIVVVPGFSVDALDTTGAGDTHVGVFLAELLAGARPLRALLDANAAAALAITRRGPGGAPTAAELAAFLAERTPPRTDPASGSDGPAGGARPRRGARRRIRP